MCEHCQAPIAVDLSGFTPEGTNTALEVLAKAQSQDGADIWAEHESPFIRGIIEAFTSQVLMRMEQLRNELDGWLERDAVKPSRARLPSGDWRNWRDRDLARIEKYLLAIPADKFSPRDWAVLSDYLVSKYLPYGTLQSEAEWLAVRALMLGRLQALYPDSSDQVIEAVASALPNAVVQAASQFKLPVVVRHVLEYGALHAMEAAAAFSDRARHMIKTVILDNRAKAMAGDPEATVDALKQTLFDRFAALNRDWRMIAVTEAGEMANQGLISALKPGTRVRRMEMYYGACAFCKRIDGMEFEVVSPDMPNKDGWKHVWVGKNNINRSASPRKRVDGVLVEREPHERWWPAAGVQHPHCRGRWEVITAAKPSDDPELARWVAQFMQASAPTA